jgi:hypothetical protein
MLCWLGFTPPVLFESCCSLKYPKKIHPCNFLQLRNQIRWDFMFSRWQVWRWMSPSFLRLIVSQKLTDVSEVITASIIRAPPNDGGSKYLWNVGQFIRDYQPQQSRLRVTLTDVSEVITASIIRAPPNDGGSKHLWNVGQFIRDYQPQQPRRRVTLTDVSEVITASIIRAPPNDGGSKHLWNVGQFIRDYHAQPRRRVTFIITPNYAYSIKAAYVLT